jgi:hypothetical protein
LINSLTTTTKSLLINPLYQSTTKIDFEKQKQLKQKRSIKHHHTLHIAESNLTPKYTATMNPALNITTDTKRETLLDEFTPPLHMHSTSHLIVHHHQSGGGGSEPSSPVFLNRREAHFRSYSLPDLFSDEKDKSDILTDKFGFSSDLNYNDLHNKEQRRRVSLPSVTERMSEESLDDCHAFKDLTMIRRVAGQKHNCLQELSTSNTTPPGLEPLVESDDEDDEPETPLLDSKAMNSHKVGLLKQLLFEFNKGHSQWKDLPNV